MSTYYKIAYAVGFTPWEKAGQADGDRIAGLFEREEVDRGGPGKALDLGCGRVCTPSRWRNGVGMSPVSTSSTRHSTRRADAPPPRK